MRDYLIERTDKLLEGCANLLNLSSQSNKETTMASTDDEFETGTASPPARGSAGGTGRRTERRTESNKKKPATNKTVFTQKMLDDFQLYKSISEKLDPSMMGHNVYFAFHQKIKVVFNFEMSQAELVETPVNIGLPIQNPDLYGINKPHPDRNPSPDRLKLYEDELKKDIPDAILDKTTPYDSSITWRMAIVRTIEACWVLWLMKPMPVIVSHATITGGNSPAQIVPTHEAYVASFLSLYTYKLMKGPNALPKAKEPCLANLKSMADYAAVVPPFLKYLVNAVNPYQTFTCTVSDLESRNLMNFKKTAASKAKAYGVWSNRYISELAAEEEDYGPSETGPQLNSEMCKGIFLPHAILLVTMYPKFYANFTGASPRYLLEDEQSQDFWGGILNATLY